jgi:hypothetical protein
MFENSFVQFAVELVRALVVDVLSGRVRERFSRLVRPGAPSYRQVLLALHHRNRNRLLNKLHTGAKREV